MRYIHNVQMSVTKHDAFLSRNKLSKDKLHKKFFIKCTFLIVSSFKHKIHSCEYTLKHT